MQESLPSVIDLPDRAKYYEARHVILEDTPWSAYIIAYAKEETQKDYFAFSPGIVVHLIYGKGDRGTAWLIAPSDLVSLDWDPESAVKRLTRYTAIHQIPVDNTFISNYRVALREAQSASFRCIVAAQAHALIGRVSFEDAKACWGTAEVQTIFES